MAKKASSKLLTPSMERGAIESGETGEKVAGLDPAAAPMETDAEAGGIPTAAQPRKDLPVRKPATDDDSTSAGPPMRQSDWDRRESHGPRKWGVTAIIGVIVVVAVILFAITLLG